MPKTVIKIQNRISVTGQVNRIQVPPWTQEIENRAGIPSRGALAEEQISKVAHISARDTEPDSGPVAC
jgi:hypothetical protein